MLQLQLSFDGTANCQVQLQIITNSDIVQLTSTQTLTNKTLTTPTINGAALSGTFSGTPTFSGAITASGGVSGNASTATALATARTIGGVSFDGSADINLPGVNAAGNQDTTGNAATATTLETARTIGGVSFNGSADIDLPGVNTAGNQNTTGSAATVTGAAQTAITSVGTLTGLTVDGDVTVSDGTNDFDVASHDGTNGLKLGGTLVTSTAAELNLVDGSSAGTVAASKAVIYGSSGEVNATTLQIGGTSITGTAGELSTYTLNVQVDLASLTSFYVIAPKAGTITSVNAINNAAIVGNGIVNMHTELGTTNITAAISPTGGAGAKYTPTINTSHDSVNAGDFIKFDVTQTATGSVTFTIEIKY